MNSLLYKKKQLKYLASLLCCKPTHIEYLCNNLKSYYGKWVEEKTDKESGKIKVYSDGTPKTRTIRPSKKILKQIQKSLKINILSKVELPKNIQGGVKKKSNKTNAKQHQGNKYQFTTDLLDFFPNITHHQIYSMYLRLGYSKYVAHWLTKLTSYEFELPQGTPTSTHIANLVFLPTDLKLIELCKANNITYTRYVDDLTFSSQKDFRHLTKHFVDVIQKGVFKIGYRKTKYEGNQTITGIKVFNNYIDAPDKIKTRAKEEVEKNLEKKPYKIYLDSIRKTNKNMQTH
ncbi:MAG TPA: reverse transcriptase family protein [Bacteroidia bacterium]|nr:reverse transcriptase family protein [Bacteroidia bacterium]